MHCALLVADLLLPPALGSEPYRELRLPALETLFARGNVAAAPALERDAWLCRAFGVAMQQDWPVAALTLAVDGVDPGNQYWLRADPVQLRVDRGRLLMAGAVTDLDAGEARDLVAALNVHFAGDGISFHAPSPHRWYLRVERIPKIVTTPLARAANRDIDPLLPRGDSALDWHRVINEAQMVLHGHAVNETREARGAAAVNSIWLWGGGTAPTVSRPPYIAAWSNDVLTHALADAAGIAWRRLPANCAEWLAAAATEAGDHLLVFDQPSAALQAGDSAAWRNELERLERDWIDPLLAALRSRRISTLALTACNGESLLDATLTPNQLRRFWRRARPLARLAGVA